MYFKRFVPSLAKIRPNRRVKRKFGRINNQKLQSFARGLTLCIGALFCLLGSLSPQAYAVTEKYCGSFGFSLGSLSSDVIRGGGFFGSSYSFGVKWKQGTFLYLQGHLFSPFSEMKNNTDPDLAALERELYGVHDKTFWFNSIGLGHMWTRSFTSQSIAKLQLLPSIGADFLFAEDVETGGLYLFPYYYSRSFKETVEGLGIGMRILFHLSNGTRRYVIGLEYRRSFFPSVSQYVVRENIERSIIQAEPGLNKLSFSVNIGPKTHEPEWWRSIRIRIPIDIFVNRNYQVFQIGIGIAFLP